MEYTKGEYTMNCECEIDRYDNQIIFCPLHASAPNLYGVLKRIAQGSVCWASREEAQKAIAEAEGVNK